MRLFNAPMVLVLAFTTVAFGAEKTALEYDLSMHAGDQFYDADFIGNNKTLSVDGITTAEALHAEYGRFMTVLGQFMNKQNMRLDNLTNQKVYNPRVLRRVEYGKSHDSMHAAAREIYEKGRAYEAWDFNGTGTLIFKPISTRNIHMLYAMSGAQIYVTDNRVKNYFDVNNGPDNWFYVLEDAYRLEKSQYDSLERNRMQSLIGFRFLNNFIGALTLTKAQQNAEYRDVLMRSIKDKEYFERMLGVANGYLVGSEVEAKVGQDLVGLLSEKKGTAFELDRINIASFPLDRKSPGSLEFGSKLGSLLERSFLQKIGKNANGIKTCKGHTVD